MWKLIKANLTWSAAAKFYIWGATGLGAYAVDHTTDLPTWAPGVIALLGLIAGWMKSQTPVRVDSAPAGPVETTIH